MNTPIADFVEKYRSSSTSRLHMPGHKGHGPLGAEALDITEIAGADSLYQASGIIQESEENASALFGTAATFYSAEGSSQCIRAMLSLALLHQNAAAPCTARTRRPVIVAARNAHQTFVLAAALLDLDIVWLWPEDQDFSLCRCTVSPRQLADTLAGLPEPPIGVYVTSPDYLGNMLDIAALSDTAHRFCVPLLVDNAHGAYLRFLPEPAASESAAETAAGCSTEKTTAAALQLMQHPMQLGADLCCDSAHKTLPVLTGGAYLHVSRTAAPDFTGNAKRALMLFGSTSPSYLILQSLDLANRYIASGFRADLAACIQQLSGLRRTLAENGWKLLKSDPLKLTIAAGESGYTGNALADILRNGGVECEYADPDYTVLMAAPFNTVSDYARIAAALGRNLSAPLKRPALHLAHPEQVCSVREAAFSACENIPAESAAGRILASPSVGCPPAVPVVVGGERIAPDAAAIFRYYGIRKVQVIRN